MAAQLRSSGTRVRFCVTLFIALSTSGGWGRVPPLAAQEVPSEVASELVDEALVHELELPRGEIVATESTGAMSLLLLVSAGVGFLISLGLLRADRPWERAPWRYSTGSSTHESNTDSINRFEEGVGREQAGAVPDRGSPSPNHRSRSAKPPEELKLPPHVLAIFERGAYASSEGEVPQAPQPGADHPHADSGLDILVPRLDPRRES